ncbi:MAG TPA: cytochrome C [Aestuariivirga sp.]|nr:cytochrome C [Aestuariivirga sp.]
MMLKLPFISAVALLVLAVVPAVQANSQTPIPADPGRGDFMTYCAACHGVSGVGDGTVAEFLTLSAANLTQMSVKNGGIFPRQRAIEVIDGRAQVSVHGERDMPVWGDWFKFEADSDGAGEKTEKVVRERITALVDYLESLQQH